VSNGWFLSCRRLWTRDALLACLDRQLQLGGQVSATAHASPLLLLSQFVSIVLFSLCCSPAWVFAASPAFVTRDEFHVVAIVMKAFKKLFMHWHLLLFLVFFTITYSR
jgi:hypothetical protein